MDTAGDSIDFRIGPVPAAAARAWIGAARIELETFRTAGLALPFRIPDEVAARMDAFLRAWQQLAEEREPFVYVGRQDGANARLLLTYWLNMISLSESQRKSLGLKGPPAEGESFARAINRAILEAVSSHEELGAIGDGVRRRPRR